MKTCPKCKYQDNSKYPESCPRCGVIYAKVEETKRTKIAQDRLNKQFEDTLRREEEVYSEFEGFYDREWQNDQDSYPLVQNLTAVFNIFAIGAGLSYVIGGIV